MKAKDVGTKHASGFDKKIFQKNTYCLAARSVTAQIGRNDIFTLSHGRKGGFWLTAGPLELAWSPIPSSLSSPIVVKL